MSKVIAKSEGEYSTFVIRRMRSGRFQLRHENGGVRGAHNRQDGDGVWRDHDCDEPRWIDADEVETLMEQWGYDDDAIGEVLDQPGKAD